MNAIASLESMGLTLSLTPDGKLALEGLKRLSTAQREHVLAVAREHKPDILDELRRREAVQTTGNRYADYWHSVCPDYWRGCPTCPDADLYHVDENGNPVALKARFCKRHDPPPWAREAVQGRLLQ